MRSPLRLARLAAAVFAAALTLAALPVLAQDVGVDPTDYLNFIPEKYRSLALAVLAGGYTALIIARRFTSPTSKAGVFVRSILSGWKHPDELPGKLTPPAAAAVQAGLQNDVAAPTPLAPPKGFGLAPLVFALAVVTGILLWIFSPAYAHAQDGTAGTGSGTAGGAPVTAPVSALAFPLTADLTLRPNLSVVAFSYDTSHKAYLGQGQIAGLYALTSARLYGAGVIAGGSITFDSSSKPLGEVNAGLVSPKVALSSVLSLHAAVMYARRFGPDSANLLRVAPTLEF